MEQRANQHRKNRASAHLIGSAGSNSNKFKELWRKKQNSQILTSFENDSEHVKRDFQDLQNKFAQKNKMKAVTRNFNKSFYGRMANKVMEKPLSFYKFGLKENQRNSCKNVFKQIFHLNEDQMKGTITSNQLWDKATCLKYLKENKMFFNNEVMVQQFQSLDKEEKKKKIKAELQKQKEYVQKYRLWEKQSEKLNLNNSKYQKMKGTNYKQVCIFINESIGKLSIPKQSKKRSKSRKILRCLQKNNEDFSRIQSSLKNNLMVLM